MSRSEYDANRALSRMDIDAPIIGGTVYPDDETEDESPYVDVTEGMVLAIAMTLLCVLIGFVAGFYFY